MGRIVFFLILAFCALLAFRLVAKLRRGDPAQDQGKDAETAQTNDAQSEPALVLSPCPLCAVHLPSDALADHLKQAHGAA